jgi:hypothetical protein
MKIKLSDEQISLLVNKETERLQKIFTSEKQKLEKKCEADIIALENKLKADIDKLANKFRYIEVVEPTPLKPRAKIDTEEMKQLVAEKKSVKEIAAHFKASESSIRSKLWNLKIKLSEQK